MPKAPKTPVQPGNADIDLAAQQRMSQEQAASAGGTILSPNQGEGGGAGPGANPGTQPKKSLLGS